TQPQAIDPQRFNLIDIGMTQDQVLEILGVPFESIDSSARQIHVPSVLNPQDCDHKIPCRCTNARRELFYYRGTLGESFSVYVDSAGHVCCYQRTNAFIMSLSGI